MRRKKLASLDRKTTCHGPGKTIHAGKRPPSLYGYGGLASHVEGVGNQAVVFAQSSALSPYFS